MNETRQIEIRAARPDDAPLILHFIQAIAAYESLTAEVRNDEASIRRHLFARGGSPAAECLLAFLAGGPAGYAVYFHNYSTFTGRRGLYLEDLYVEPALRGHGVGRALLQRIAAIAVARGCARMEWTVLDWNETAIRFYESLGARAMREWTLWRLAGEPLAGLAASAPRAGTEHQADREDGSD